MSHINGYYYKPTPKFNHNYDLIDMTTEFYYGVELEMDHPMCRSDIEFVSDELYKMDEGEDLFYQKHDGSLVQGIEVVTHPCTLDYHLAHFPWNKICELAQHNNFHSGDTSTCGLHVHVSRKAFGDDVEQQDLNIAKILILFNAFWPLIVKFTRRQPYQLNRWAKKTRQKIFTDENQDRVIDKSRHVRYEGRYCAVNLRNTNTVEFRIFKGTLNPDTIKATLQFLDNLIHFAKSCDLTKIAKTNWQDILHYKNYPELNQYLAKLQLDISKKVRNVSHPDVRIVRIKPGMSIVNDDRTINHDAYTVEKLSFNKFVNEYISTFEGPYTGAMVAVMAPRSNKVERIGSIRSITSAGSVRFGSERALAQSRIAYIMMPASSIPLITNNTSYIRDNNGRFAVAHTFVDVFGHGGYYVKYPDENSVRVLDSLPDEIRTLNQGDKVIFREETWEIVRCTDTYNSNPVFRIKCLNGGIFSKENWIYMDWIGKYFTPIL